MVLVERVTTVMPVVMKSTFAEDRSNYGRQFHASTECFWEILWQGQYKLGKNMHIL